MSNTKQYWTEYSDQIIHNTSRTKDGQFEELAQLMQGSLKCACPIYNLTKQQAVVSSMWWRRTPVSWMVVKGLCRSF